MRIIEKVKPKGFDDILGQKHLFEKKAVFRKLVEGGNFDSVILVGPPGSGKTVTAELVGEFHALPFFRLHASTSGAADIKNIIESTKHYGKQAVVFIDEIHRFNKSQQDLLLKVIDGQHAKLIGASTENPYHSLSQPLRSRSFIFRFESLDNEALDELFFKSSEYLKEAYYADELILSEEEYDLLKRVSLGDGRRFLNMLELSAAHGEFEGKKLKLKVEGIQEFVTGGSYDVDEHFDILSAMIKSIRGSDPDAALLWGFKLLESGVGAEEIFRRLLISASEDVGNAYPDALVFAQSAYNAFTSVGRPEGDIILAQVITYLAGCPKSNRSYKSMHAVKEFLKTANPKVPEILRVEGEGYKYPFEYGNFVKQSYKQGDEVFYNPSEFGFESKVGERLKRLWGGFKKYE